MINSKAPIDFNSIKLYNPGDFNKNYKTNLDGKLKSITKDTLNDEITKSFKSGCYSTFETLDSIILYRLYGKFQAKDSSKTIGSTLFGAYATTEFAESTIDAKMRLALKMNWGNTKFLEAKICVPPKVKLNIGIVAPVFTDAGTELPGGADQILLPRDWNIDWIIGFRKVSAWQISEIPAYSDEIPKEVITMEEFLLSIKKERESK